jgi:AraC-like DNA-binding protein
MSISKLREVKTPECTITLCDFQEGHTHNRTYCPFLQYWIITRGEWILEKSPRQSTDPGHIQVFAPGSKSRRVTSAPTQAISILFHRSVNQDHPTLPFTAQKLALLFIANKLDPITLEESVVLLHEAEQTERKTPKWLNEVRDYLIAHPESNDTLSELATQFGISPYHLAHSFRNHFHTTVSKFRQIQRLSATIPYLISNPNEPIPHLNFGFYDASHFHKTLHKHIPIRTPSLKKPQS